MNHLKMSQEHAIISSPPAKLSTSPTTTNKTCLCDCRKHGCYKYGSPDNRCCGLCYCFCPAKHNSKTLDKNRCDFCPNTFSEYLESGYFKTIDGSREDDSACFCTTICLPFKFPLFFPCFLGTLFNHACNNCCCTFANEDRNYLC